MIKNFDFQAAANQVLDIEISSLHKLSSYFDEQFTKVCQLILVNQGKVVVMGMGKSGHIGNKIAATLASTGTAAFFVHPSEAAHGDLGMISPNDIVLAISNSGESSEILALFPILKRLKNKIISMTGDINSSMAKLSDLHLCIAVEKEACPLGLAPTSSTTVTLVMGDALAVALLQAKNFSAADFALSHPGGAIGRRLLLKLADIMHTKDANPKVYPDTLICDALVEISKKGLGMTSVIDAQDKLLGIFTDGDLRRALDQKIDIYSTPIKDVMTLNPRVADPKLLAIDGMNLMQQSNINCLLLCEQQKLVGAINMHDLLRVGIL